jgi:hypothetical protein
VTEASRVTAVVTEHPRGRLLLSQEMLLLSPAMLLSLEQRSALHRERVS